MCSCPPVPQCSSAPANTLVTSSAPRAPRSSEMDWRSLRPFVAAAASSSLVVVGAVLALTRPSAPEVGSATPSPPSQVAGLTGRLHRSSQRRKPLPGDPASAEIARLRAAPRVAPGPANRRIRGDFTQQPDLYAAEFVRRLLTQDYRTPRAEHLAWVQSEAAQTSEPLVVGLVPRELRDHLAVYSVTDSEGQAPVVPTQREWTALAVQHAYTTVRIERVNEPMAWSTAVSSGHISDPGITAARFSASVTLHYQKESRLVASTSSVAMTLNIQGPPSRRSWAS